MRTGQTACMILLAAAMPAAAQPWFRGVGYFEGGANGIASGVSEDGMFVVGYANHNADQESYRWTLAGGLKSLGDLPGGLVRGEARAVSAHGFHVVGVSNVAAGEEGYRWQNGVMTGIGDLPGGSFRSSGDGISADGSVLIGSSNTLAGAQDTPHAFRSVRGGPLLILGDLPNGAGYTVAAGISDDGSVIVGQARVPASFEAFRWTASGGMVGLGDLTGGTFYSAADAVSGDGSVVVGFSEGAAGVEAFRWTQAGGMVGLGDLPGGAFSSGAAAVNGDGSIIGGYSSATPGNNNSAFIWDAQNGMRNLRDLLVARGVGGLDGWQLIGVGGMSGDGLTLAGLGINPDNNYEGWVAYLGQPIGKATERVSIGDAEQQGNLGSTQGSVSTNGQVVAFWSNASNLVAGDTNGKSDVFFRNRTAGWTARVSVSTAGTQGNGASIDPQISSDGRFVVFVSDATNLVASDTNAKRDVFIRDRVAATTARISISTAGAQSNGASDAPRISSDGRFVVFQSAATNLVAGDTNNATDIFLRDRLSGTTTRVSLNSAGQQAGGDSTRGSVADNGLSVAFVSTAANLVAGDTNAAPDVFLRNRSTGATTRVSVSSDGAQANGDSTSALISGNGRYIAFVSSAINLAYGDTNAADDVFVRDRFNSTTTRISLAPVQSNADCLLGAISASGRYVLYSSPATNLTPGDTNEARDAFLHDGWTFLTARVSVGNQGQQAAAACTGTALSADGRYAVFNSIAGNLVPGDTGGFSDVFLRDLRKPQ